MEGVRRRKRDMVDRLIEIHLTNYEKSGAELIMGEGHLSGAHTLEIKSRDGGTRRFTAERIFLNVGTHAYMPDIPGLIAARPLTHLEWLELDRTPDHLLILGGGLRRSRAWPGSQTLK